MIDRSSCFTDHPDADRVQDDTCHGLRKLSGPNTYTGSYHMTQNKIVHVLYD